MSVATSLFDDHPELLIALLAIIVLGGIVLIIVRIVLGARLAKASRLLESGHIPEAHRLFLSVARQSFATSVALLEKALAGLAETYSKAGIKVDLSRIRELRGDLQSLQGDKKYHSALFGSAGDNLTAEGVKIKNSIEARARQEFDGLPTLGQRGASFTYKCPKCSAELENSFSMAGKSDTCPICRNVHTVPLPAGGAIRG